MPFLDKITEVSFKHIKNLGEALNKPINLMGGWAVHILVNDNFKENEGKNYVGSQDIDLGFHIDPDWSEDQLKQSQIATTISILKSIGFIGIGFRFAKHFDYDTLLELNGEKLNIIPTHNQISMCVDPIVRCNHTNFKKIFGFDPIEETLLNHFFNDKNNKQEINFNGVDLVLPSPQLLLAMKLSCTEKRKEKKEKLEKDIADVFALFWYSNLNFKDIKTKLFKIMKREKVLEIINNWDKKRINGAADFIGVDVKKLEKVFSSV